MELKQLAERPDYVAIVDAAARAAHEANRAYCESIGDKSQVPYDEAPQWQKDSAAAGVLFIIGNPDAGDAAQHESWAIQKIKDGWVYGAVKDAELKTHPCLVDFDKLPAEQQEKDRIFRRTVLAHLAAVQPLPVERGACPKVVGVAKYGDRIPVQVRDWVHYDNLVAQHGAGSVTVIEQGDA